MAIPVRKVGKKGTIGRGYFMKKIHEGITQNRKIAIHTFPNVLGICQTLVPRFVEITPHIGTYKGRDTRESNRGTGLSLKFSNRLCISCGKNIHFLD